MTMTNERIQARRERILQAMYEKEEQRVRMGSATAYLSVPRSLLPALGLKAGEFPDPVSILVEGRSKRPSEIMGWSVHVGLYGRDGQAVAEMGHLFLWARWQGNLGVREHADTVRAVVDERLERIGDVSGVRLWEEDSGGKVTFLAYDVIHDGADLWGAHERALGIDEAVCREALRRLDLPARPS